MDIKNSICLITGSASRIGAEIATYLAKNRAKVIIHYNKNKIAAINLCNNLTNIGLKAQTIYCNLLELKSISSFYNQVCKIFGPPNILINNASIFNSKDDKKFFHIHYDAPKILIDCFYKHSKKGCIINITDSSIKKDSINYHEYYESKNALSILTREKALELAPNIRVNEIAPGFILPSDDIDIFNNMTKIIPLKKTGNINEILLAINYLISSEYVTGQRMNIDGGLSLLKK